jgi:hypothetical protein
MIWTPADTEKARAWIVLAMEDMDDAFLVEGGDYIERLLDFVPKPPKPPYLCPKCEVALKLVGETLVCSNAECPAVCFSIGAE